MSRLTELSQRLAVALIECGHDISWADVVDALDAAGLQLAEMGEDAQSQKSA